MRWLFLFGFTGVASAGTRVRTDYCRYVNSAARSGSMQYSAEAAGNGGQLHCHVVRRRFGLDGRAQYSITVGNETNDEASVVAFAAGLLDSSAQTIVRTTIGVRSEFSTSSAFELPLSGATPELHVVVSSGDIGFTLVVPGLPPDRVSSPEAPQLLAGATALVSHNGIHMVLPALRQLPAAAAFVAPAIAAPGVAEPVLAVPAVAMPAATGLAATAPAVAGPGSVASPNNGNARPIAAWEPPGTLPILVFFGSVVAAVAFIVLRPQIGDLSVPDSAAPGAAVIVGYTATGLGSATYSVLAPDGAAIARGRLALGTGRFTLTAPPSRATAQAYRVRVQVAGALGTASVEDDLRVVAGTSAATVISDAPPQRVARRSQRPGALDPPRIRSLALDRATVASGETLGVYYDVLATTGSIVLTDPTAQLTYGKAALSASGSTRFVAPYVDAPRMLSVIVTAQRGSATTQSRLMVTVKPPAAPAVARPPDATDNYRPNDAGAGDPGAVNADRLPRDVAPSTMLMTAPATVHSRQPIRLAIQHALAPLAVVMLDESGAEIARRDVPSGRATVEFTAPPVRVATRFFFTATYPQGQGSETIVRNVRVIP